MTLHILTLSKEGLAVAQKIADSFEGAFVHAHKSVGAENPKITTFDRVADKTASLFQPHGRLVYVAPLGVVVRSIAPLLEHKATDPAVVAVDVGARFAVSVLSGHEGGANTLAYRVAAAIGATPVISTTTEALKTLVVGIGCRRGTSAETIIRTIDRTLEEVGRKPEEIRLIASADIKRKEKGILKAAEHFSAGTFFVPSETIRAFAGAFEESDFVKAKVNLPAVAQPAAMLAALRPKLLLPRKKWSGITIAIVEENCSLWE